ncbi:MAG: HAD-IB family phosphatase [Candidatus Bathyarchaeia archaeon]
MNDSTIQPTSVVLSDFDGTIVDIDTGAFALQRFASGDWKALDRKMVKGELTYEECLRRQFRMINAPIDTIVKKIDEVASLRPHFIELVNYCLEKSVKFVIVSGGLDFYIRHVLHKNKLEVEVCVPKCNLDKAGLNFQFPQISDSTSFSFKDDMVRQYRRSGSTVLYVGDGYADYYALKEASVRFAVAGSSAARLCSNNGISFQEISNFLPVIQELDRLKVGHAQNGCDSI